MGSASAASRGNSRRMAGNRFNVPRFAILKPLVQTQVLYRVDRRCKCFKLERLPN